jgi:hypothetical protein
MTRNRQLISILLILLLTPFEAILAKDDSVAAQAHALMQEFFDEGDTPPEAKRR